MNKTILNITFSRLQKREIKNLTLRVIKAVDGYDPEALKIKEIYDLLVEMKPQIDSLQLRHLAHPISDDLKALRRQRIAFAQGIVDQMKTLEYGATGDKNSLKVAKPLIMQHLKGLSRLGDGAIYDNIYTFSCLLSKSEELMTAISTLELERPLENLLNVNSAIEAQFLARSKSISERPKNPTPTIVAAIKSALDYLFKQIEVAQIKNQELDYTPLIDELNEAIVYYRTISKARASYNKKKAEGVLDEDEVVEKDNEVVVEDESEVILMSNEPADRMYPISVEMDNENSDLLDIEKTVAESGKQTRLPIVSTEA